jgi:hypothetical protein
MKKVLMIVIAVIVVVLIVLFSRRPGEIPPFADIFPGNAIAYAGASGGAGFIELILQSEAYEKLASLESVRKFERQQFAVFGEKGIPEFPLGEVASLLGDKVAIAVYGKESRVGATLLLASHTAEADTVLRFLNGLGAVPEGRHSGMDLYSLKSSLLPKFKIAYAHKGRTVILVLTKARALEMVKEVIGGTQFRGEASLASDEDFKSALGKPPCMNGRFLGCAYVDLGELGEEITNLRPLREKMREVNPRLAGSLDCMLNRCRLFETLGVYLYRDRGIAGKMVARVAPSVRTKGYLSKSFAQPGRLELLGLVPKDTVLLSAYRLGNVQDAWKLYQEKAGEGSQFAFLAGVGEKLGIDVEREVFPWVGEEMSFQFSGLVTGGLFPIPEAEVIIKVKDRGAAEKTISRIMGTLAQPLSKDTQVDRQPWAFLKPQLATEEYNGATLKTLAYPIPEFSPTVTVLGDYLVIGSNRSSVREIVDIQKKAKASIFRNKMFAELLGFAPDTMISLGFLDCHRALDNAGSFIRWFLDARKLVRVARGEEESPEPDQLEKDLPEILDALKVFQSAMSASTAHGQSFERIFVIRVREEK